MNTTSLSFAAFIKKSIRFLNILGVLILPTLALAIGKLFSADPSSSKLIVGITAGITLLVGVGTGIGFYQFWQDKNEPVARQVRQGAFVSGVIGALLALAYVFVA